jgi:hypothetical protein
MMYRILSKVYLAAFIFTIGWITGVVNAGQAIKSGKVRGVTFKKDGKTPEESFTDLLDKTHNPNIPLWPSRIRTERHGAERHTE